MEVKDSQKWTIFFLSESDIWLPFKDSDGTVHPGKIRHFTVLTYILTLIYVPDFNLTILKTEQRVSS